MERNKGEAIRAMQLSELRIQENDFAGAREMARLAHQLFPEDENICKLLALSEVYYSIFESGQSCGIRDTARVDFEQLVGNVSSPSGSLNDDDDDDEGDDGDDDSDDDYNYDDDDDDDGDEEDDYDGNNGYDDDDDDDDDDGDADFVIAPKRLRERQLKSYTEKKEKNSVEGVSKSAVSRPKRLRHSQFVNVFNRMHDTLKDHDSISPMKCSSTPPSSTAQFYDFGAQKSEDKIRVGQIWALYSDGNGMPKTFAQVKKVNVEPNRRIQKTLSSGKFYLRMGLLEPFSVPRNLVEPVCCGRFKVKRAPPTLFSVTSLSHRIKAKLLDHNIFEIIPRRGEVWALYKEHDPLVAYPYLGKGECLVVEVLEAEHGSTKIVVLEQLNGYKWVFKAPTVQSTKTGVFDIPKDELGRFSHQIPAFKHTKMSNCRLAGCWELDPLTIPGYEKVDVPNCLFHCDPASLVNTPDFSRNHGDMKMDQTSMKSETHGLSGEFLEVEAEPEMGSASMQTANIQQTPFADIKTSTKAESRGCHFSFFGKDLADSVKLEASQCVNAVDNGIHITKDGNLTHPKGSAIPLLG